MTETQEPSVTGSDDAITPEDSQSVAPEAPKDNQPEAPEQAPDADSSESASGDVDDAVESVATDKSEEDSEALLDDDPLRDPNWTPGEALVNSARI